jgi:hypothetical protein
MERPGSTGLVGSALSRYVAGPAPPRAAGLRRPVDTIHESRAKL